MYRDKFKKYLYRKLKDLTLDEKYTMLSEIKIAAEEMTSELNQHCIYCESCKKHFLKTDCKARTVDEREFIQDDEDNDNMFVKGKNMVYTILYRICPECGKDDLYDKILQSKMEE